MKKVLHVLLFSLMLAGCTTTTKLTTVDVPDKDRQMFELVTKKAQENNVPVKLAHAVVEVESSYNPRLRGAQGEYGLGQILCSTAKGIGFKDKCDALYDPSVNLTWSMKYLRMALDRTRDDECGAATLYNRGFGNGYYSPKPSRYCRKVMASLK